ncbi:DUF1549 domain-containing protein [Persicimonas caeni]|uniref:DUF1549 domain-containing protein n=1 Tax=Persicimonas caeni TaxID=2292766 RepID=A0A4Y6Q2V1_PERCE|nr:DUF1549 domain-containing protein [Persicimonas caeni]QED36142.1 DUF1549 domain-containing protein [Persicimonas caeni]
MVKPMAVCLIALWVASGCQQEPSDFDPINPGKGPGQMVGNDGPLNTGPFAGVDQSMPQTRQVDPPDDASLPDCGEDCLDYCNSLDLQNPVNRGLCPSLWGVGLEPRPVQTAEACRRLFADMIGRFPTEQEVASVCKDRPWAEVVNDLMSRDEFVELNQRFWADRLLYNNEAVSVVRIFDADDLVGKLYRGEVPYDQFAAVVSAHPVLTRRYATAGDRAEALFWLLMGRPPLGSERSDLARLYNLWHNGYYDHPHLGERLPDAFIEYECVTDEGEVNSETKGACTSVLWGYNELILKPDMRAEEDGEVMWSGLLKDHEWEKLQLPGKILAGQSEFWEKAVDDVLEQYLGYDLGRMAPEVRNELVSHLLEHDADIRSVHFAVATSAAYLQSAQGQTDTRFRWTWGPLKQVHAETWLDTIEHTTGYELGDCDHRIPETRDLERSDRLGTIALLKNSRWPLEDDGDIDDGYRSLAQALGGCPRNDVGGRFRIVSILTTAQQLNFVNRICNPSFDGDLDGVDASMLLPPDIDPDVAVDRELAAKIVGYQTKKFFSRSASGSELDDARDHGEACSRQVCTAEEFARPACFALLSSSEMLFY